MYEDSTLNLQDVGKQKIFLLYLIQNNNTNVLILWYKRGAKRKIAKRKILSKYNSKWRENNEKI